MKDAVLTFKQVNFSYGNKKVVRNCSFTVYDHEFISILGPSGCGKTTLFRLISGLEHETSGDIILHGNQSDSRIGLTGYMPQNHLLMPWKTIVDNVAIPLIIKGMSKVEAKRKSFELLEDFQLASVANKYPHELSGGMMQRVAFARTVLTNADLLILDEPFSALDAITKRTMQEWLLEKWSKMKRTVIFITHDVDEAIFLSDRIFLFQKQSKGQLMDYKVPLSRPRTIELMAKANMVQFKQILMNKLREPTR